MNDYIERSVIAVFGGVPDTWGGSYVEKLKALHANLPEVSKGFKMPLSTYLYWLLDNYGYSPKVTFLPSLCSVKTYNLFLEKLQILYEDSLLRVALDLKACETQVTAFGGVDSCIFEPRLYVSPVYRYILAQEHGMGMLLEGTDVYDTALTQLRKNPYTYFAYGDIAQMPVRWEEL